MWPSSPTTHGRSPTTWRSRATRCCATTFLQNGQHPDPVRAMTPDADIVYDGTGTGNCFADDVFRIEFPAGITTLFSCGG
jgi:hypothetical protein